MNIDASLVCQLVTDQFPQWARLAVKPVEFGGWDNRTFHLGDDMLVRMPGAQRYAAKVAMEHEWLPKLGPRLPFPIPVPLAMGAPGSGYPWNWSIYQWIEGENACVGHIDSLSRFAKDVAQFLSALQQLDSTNGPLPGAHNFYRGGPLATYDAETRNAVDVLNGAIDINAVMSVWNAALEATWSRPPVWIHGDVSAGNLLVLEGRLNAVIDFGGMGVGDPACDLVIAWTLFHGASRDAFRSGLSLDPRTWARARGWALWKALITIAEHNDDSSPQSQTARQTINAVLADHANAA